MLCVQEINVFKGETTFRNICKWIPVLTHWGRVTHICVSKQTIIGSDNGLSPGRRQAIIWTNAGILLIGSLGTNFSEVLIEIRILSFKKMGLNVSSAKWRTFCLGLNVLTNFKQHFWTLERVLTFLWKINGVWVTSEATGSPCIVIIDLRLLNRLLCDPRVLLPAETADAQSIRTRNQYNNKTFLAIYLT